MLRKTIRNMGRLPLLSVAVLVLVVMSGVLANFLTPYSPTAIDLRNNLAPPLSEGHLLGTDNLGRDVLARLLYGARVSLLMVAGALGIGIVLGGGLGLVAGYRRGILDEIIMRSADAFLGFPLLILAILFAVAFGPTMTGVIVVVQLYLWPRFARIVRAEVLLVRESDFIAIARMSGASEISIVKNHVIPHVMNSLIVIASLQAAWVVIVEASLSFLGAGVPPPNPSWGGMISSGRGVILSSWWIATFPAIAVIMFVMSLNLFGDWLRDSLDPKLRNAR